MYAPLCSYATRRACLLLFDRLPSGGFVGDLAMLGNDTTAMDQNVFATLSQCLATDSNIRLAAEAAMKDLAQHPGWCFSCSENNLAVPNFQRA